MDFIRIVIADDDAIILKSMRKFINWEDYGYIIVGEASNGKELVEICRRIKPQVVITDIEMPKLSGFGAVDILLNEYPEMKIIIISGFDKFKYAQQAIDKGVYNYILKPINPVELIAILKKLKLKISTKATGEQPVKDTSHKENREIQYPKDIRLVVDIVKKSIDDGEDENTTLEYIESAFSTNANYFSRIFKSRVGMSFAQYRFVKKMDKAKMLIKDTALKFYEIADILGYEDERYFCRLFKKYSGKTPREYKEDFTKG